ncbi:MAG: hypothetical protein JNK09_11625 [Prolixibacteraceae bacterium]|nr:hypothetical protein [Prolixibacteraceae bacterium]
MQKQFSNRLRMYQALQSMMSGNQVKWEAVQAIANAFHDFERLLEEIDACSTVTSDRKKGETVQKKELRMRVIDRAMEVSSVLYALIVQTNEQYVGAKLDYTQTKLFKMRDLQLVVACECIVTEAHHHLTLLGTANITANDIETLSADIKTFADLLPRQRLSVTGRKVANAKLKDLFAQTDALLKNQLDRLMLRFKQTHPEFYSSYKTSRHVINYGVRHNKGKGEEKVG